MPSIAKAAAIPDTKLAKAITEFIRDTETELLFNHSSRVYHFGALAGIQRGLTFDLTFMTVQAAIDGIGVAMGRTSYVQDDVAKGRLVVPFKIALPADAGFYLVSPEGRDDPPKLRVFRQWLAAAVQHKS